MNNTAKIKIPEGNKFYLKPKEALVINKFLPFGIKLERNTLNSVYFESKMIFRRKRLRSSGEKQPIVDQENKKESESESERKSENESGSLYQEEEESLSDEELNNNDTESFQPDEQNAKSSSKNQTPKKEKRGRKKKETNQNTNQGPKQKTTRALTKKQPKGVQDQYKQHQTHPQFQIQNQQNVPQTITNTNQMTIEQSFSTQPKKQSMTKPQKRPKPLQTITQAIRSHPNNKRKTGMPKMTPKLKLLTHHEKKEKIYLVNLKCSKGLERLLENSLSALFYDSKHPDCPSLKMIEHKLTKKEYKTIYDFGHDLRRIWNFYFKYYSSSPQYYQLTYNMSEYSENVITELEEMTNFSIHQETKGIECLSMEEKEELGENINLLSQTDLKKLIQLFDNNMMKKDGNKKLFEFDINSLPNETQMKMYRFVKRCIHNQLTGEQDYDKEEQIEMERIQKLKNDLGISNDTNNVN